MLWRLHLLNLGEVECCNVTVKDNSNKRTISLLRKYGNFTVVMFAANSTNRELPAVAVVPEPVDDPRVGAAVNEIRRRPANRGQGSN